MDLHISYYMLAWAATQILFSQTEQDPADVYIQLRVLFEKELKTNH